MPRPDRASFFYRGELLSCTKRLDMSTKSSFLKLAAERYSCRGFQSKPVSDEDIAAILEAARLAPTAVNKQPVHVWVMKSPEARAKLKEATPLIRCILLSW